jgi:hypothetical protein
MTTEYTALTRLQPDVIQVESMGIGLYRTNDTLDLASNQYLVIGEGTDVGSFGAHTQHNLIVDNSGVAINSDLNTRDTRGYALYVKGDVFVEGIVRGSGFNSNIANTINQNTLFQPVIYSTYNNIYSTNLVNITQSELQARSNTHKLNVLSTPNLDITKAQLNIQNSELSQFRLGILGNDKHSPVVFNTPSNIPIEFHVGRSKEYFQNTYKRYELNGSSVSTNLPNYTSSSDAPHMIIDVDGNIGIQTQQSKRFTYTTPVSTNVDGFVEYTESTSNMALYVNAPMYANEILIFDKYTNSACNIDSLFVRAIGQSINANQIRPGPFARGTFTFTSNVIIDSPTTDALRVRGDIHALSNVVVDGTVYAQHAQLTDLKVYQPAHFTDAVTVDKTLTASNILRFGTLLQTQDETGQWVNVDFNVRQRNDYYSNIEEIGTNVFVKNRMAVGINLSNAEELPSVFHQQFVIEKGTENRYELELWDRTLAPFNRKVAVIGHGQVDASMKYTDASMLITTGTATEEYYNALGRNFYNLQRLPQNIYFYPGQYEHSNVYKSIIRPDNPPILGIFENKTIGINTFSPLKQFHVNGDAFIAGDIYVNDSNLVNPLVSLAKIYQDNAIPRIVNATQTTFKGIKYVNADAPHVGFNTAPEFEYGVVIDKGLKVKGGYFDDQNRELAGWYKSPVNASRIYTNTNAGINVSDPQYPLDIYESRTSQPTYLNIRANQTELTGASNYIKGGLQFTLPGQQWVAEAGIEYADKSKVKQAFAIYDSRSTQCNVLIAGQYFAEGRHQVYVGDIYDKGYYGISNVTYDDTLIVGGNATIFGNLNVTNDLNVDGNITIRGRSVTISPDLVACNVVTPANPNDVMIAGRIVHMLPVAPNPSSTFSSTSTIDTNREAYVSIGYTLDTDATINNKSDYSTYPILRVHQYINSPVVARFSSDYSLAQIDVQAAGSGRLRFGLDTINNKSALVFIDRTNPSTPKYFIKSINDSLINSFTGFNLPETVAPTANLHIYNSDQGTNMALLQYVSTTLDTLYAPTLTLTKTYAGYNQSRSWNISGPHNTPTETVEKLSFTYGSNQVKQEVFTITKDGRVGIGNTIPTYSLDVLCTKNSDALRLYNPTNSAVPMLIFQSGPSNVYGQDEFYDYRMFSASNNFYIKQAYNGQESVLVNFNRNGNMGIKTDANANYSVNINGYLNISDGILLNGTPFVFKRESSNILTGITVDDDGNIYINPASFFGNSSNNGYRSGVVIGGSMPTSNLFHIYSGSNANMTVYDSLFPEAQVHFKTHNAVTKNNSTYRMYASNQIFAFEYNPIHSSCNEITDSHDVYIPILDMQYNPAMENPSQLHVRGDLNFTSNVSTIRFQQTSITTTPNGSLSILPLSNVGIGTTQTIAKLDIFTNSPLPVLNVAQQGSGYLAHFVGNTSDSKVVIDRYGNIGIGTVSPLEKLQVIGNISSDYIYPNSSNGSDIGSTLKPWRKLYLDTALSINQIEFKLQENKFIDIENSSQQSYPLRYSKWYIDKPDTQGNSVIIERSDNSQNPNDIVFFDVVMSNLSNNLEITRLRPVLFSPIDNRIGINTLAPQAVLHVEIPSNAVGESLIIRSSNASNILAIYDRFNNRALDISEKGTIGLGSNATLNAQVSITSSNSVPTVYIQQKSIGDILVINNALSNVLVVKNNGFIGIGTDLPQSNVHIEGNLKVSGTIVASNLEVLNIKTMDVEISYSEQSVITNAGNGPAFTVVQVGEAPIAEFKYGPIGQNKSISMALTNTGNVGIGTGIPMYPLDIKGTTQANRILYQNNFTNLQDLTSNAPSYRYPAMYAGVQQFGALQPYYSTSNTWERIALYNEIEAEVDRNRGLKYTILSTTSTNSSNYIQFSGPGVYNKNSNNTEFKVYRGFDYTFTNASTTPIEFVRKTVGITSVTLSNYTTIEDTNILYNSNYSYIGSGLGYSNPTVLISGGNGEIAQASVKVNGSISDYIIQRGGLMSKPGFSFTIAPQQCISTSVISQLNDTFAPRIKLNLDGRVQPIEFIEFPGLNKEGIQGSIGRGSNLSNVSLEFQLAPGETNGEYASGYVTIRGSISNIVLTTNGSGYSNPLIRIYDSSLQTFGNAVASATVIGDIRVLHPSVGGGGYSNPILSYTSPENNYTFSAHPILSASIEKINITDPGFGYSNPSIQITNTPGNRITSTAQFNITVIGGISNLILTNEGAGYSNPIIQTTYLNPEAEGTILTPILHGTISSIPITNRDINSDFGNKGLYSNVYATIEHSTDTFYFEPDVNDSQLYGVYVEGGEGYITGETLKIDFEDVCRDATDGTDAGACEFTLEPVNPINGAIIPKIYAMSALNKGTRYMRPPRATVNHIITANPGSNATAVAIAIGNLGLMQCLPSTYTLSKSLPSEYFSNIQFGKSIDMDYTGNKIIIGAYGDGIIPYSGKKAYLYEFNSNTMSWDSNIFYAGDTFSYASNYAFKVSLSGNASVASVSAPLIDLNGDAQPDGKVEIYTNTANTWNLTTTLYSQCNFSEFGFGTDIDYSGNTVVVSSPSYLNTHGCNIGCVEIFKRSDTLWNRHQILSNVSPSFTGTNFGHSVAISGTGKIIIVGSPNLMYESSNTGCVNLYSELPNGTYSLLSNILPSMYHPSSNNNYFFGTEVACDRDGNAFIVGTSLNMAFVYNRIGITSNFKETQLVSPYLYKPRIYGSNVGISPDGYTAFVQELETWTSSYTSRRFDYMGTIHVYKYNNKQEQWNYSYFLRNDIDPVIPYDYFGTSISSSYDGHRVAIGMVQQNTIVIDQESGSNVIEWFSNVNHKVKIHDFNIYTSTPLPNTLSFTCNALSNILNIQGSDLIAIVPTAYMTIQGSISNVVIDDYGSNITQTPTFQILDTYTNASNASIYPMLIGSISNVAITQPGMGYSNTLQISINENSYLSASLIPASVYADVYGSIDGFIYYDHGSNYTQHPSFSIIETSNHPLETNKPITNAVLIPHIIGSISNITIHNPGHGYSNATILIDNDSNVNDWNLFYNKYGIAYPPIVNATAYSEVRGYIDSIVLTNPGSNYSVAPKLVFTDTYSNASTLLPNATCRILGPLCNIDFTTAVNNNMTGRGYGFFIPPTFTIYDNDTVYNTSNANYLSNVYPLYQGDYEELRKSIYEASVSLFTNGPIYSISLDNPGKNYESLPSIQIYENSNNYINTSASVQCNIDTIYIGVDVGMLHSDLSKRPIYDSNYKIYQNEQVVFTIPLDAPDGSNYKYRVVGQSNLSGNIVIV